MKNDCGNASEIIGVHVDYHHERAFFEPPSHVTFRHSTTFRSAIFALYAAILLSIKNSVPFFTFQYHSSSWAVIVHRLCCRKFCGRPKHISSTSFPVWLRQRWMTWRWRTSSPLCATTLSQSCFPRRLDKTTKHTVTIIITILLSY